LPNLQHWRKNGVSDYFLILRLKNNVN